MHVVKLYSLAPSSGVRQTDMDIYSYGVVLKNMVENYKISIRNNEMNCNYLPILPAPPITNGIPEEINRITFSNIPKSTYEYCDNRFMRFILSPYTLLDLVNCFDKKEEDVLDFNHLVKETCSNCIKQNCNNADAERKRQFDYASLYSQSIEYMRAIYSAGNAFNEDFQVIDSKIIDIWGAFAELIKNLLLGNNTV